MGMARRSTTDTCQCSSIREIKAFWIGGVGLHAIARNAASAQQDACLTPCLIRNNEHIVNFLSKEHMNISLFVGDLKAVSEFRRRCVVRMSY